MSHCTGVARKIKHHPSPQTFWILNKWLINKIQSSPHTVTKRKYRESRVFQTLLHRSAELVFSVNINLLQFFTDSHKAFVSYCVGVSWAHENVHDVYMLWQKYDRGMSPGLFHHTTFRTCSTAGRYLYWMYLCSPYTLTLYQNIIIIIRHFNKQNANKVSLCYKPVPSNQHCHS